MASAHHQNRLLCPDESEPHAGLDISLVRAASFPLRLAVSILGGFLAGATTVTRPRYVVDAVRGLGTISAQMRIWVDGAVPAGMAVGRPQPGPEVRRVEVRQRGGHGGVRGLRGDRASAQAGTPHQGQLHDL